MQTAAIIAALVMAPATGPPASADPFVVAAKAALEGKACKPWQRAAYEIGLARGARCRGFTYLTSYGPWENPRMSGGPYAAQGMPGGKRRRLDVTMCAADRGLPFGTVIWCHGELRVVRDRGGWVTVPMARKKCGRNDRNLDFYTLSPDQHYGRSMPYAVVCRDVDVHRH